MAIRNAFDQCKTIFNLIIFLNALLPLLYSVCGLGCGKVNLSRPVIRNGISSLRGEWPFIAALYELDHSKFFCGGTLITSQHVLTAAHCIQQKFSSVKLSPDNLTVRLGAHNLTNKLEIGMVERNVTDIHVHPDWDVYVVEFNADIAIVDLSARVDFTIYIQPICLPMNGDIEGIDGSIVGWGIANNEQIEPIPQFTITKILNNSYCFKQDPPIVAYSSSNTFCGGKGDGTPNRGDSGGGIFGTDNHSWVQYGVISAVRTNGTGHVTRNSFAVYTKISIFKNWIVETAKTNDSVYISLACHYRSLYFSPIYKCFLYNLDVRSVNTEIASIADTHIAGKTDRSVEELQFFNGTMFYIPNGIGKFFTNLKNFVVGRGFSMEMFTETKLIQRSNFKDLNKVERVQIYRNNIDDLAEDSLWDLENLNEFKLVYNKLKILHERTFEMNRKLQIIKMHTNEIASLPRDLFRTNLLLKEIDFRRNSITAIDARTFACNEMLELLALSSNQLKTLPGRIFVNNLLLVSIGLQNNSITEIDEHLFQNNVKLISVGADDNRVEYLPKHLFTNNSILYAISFSRNLLKTIDTDFTENFKLIDFTANKCIDAKYDERRVNIAYSKKNFLALIKENCQRKQQT